MSLQINGKMCKAANCGLTRDAQNERKHGEEHMRVL